jgi:four helix bundle protein
MGQRTVLSRIERFEEIRAWQMAKELVAEVYRETDNGAFARDFSLRDQLRRASVSIMSNIAEGFERSSKKEFQRFLYMAKGSAGEVRSHLYVAAELRYLGPEMTQELIKRAEEVSKSVSAFITYLSADIANFRTFKR